MTYNNEYLLVVTHLITDPLVRCLNRAERAGSLTVTCLVDIKPRNLLVYRTLASQNRILRSQISS